MLSLPRSLLALVAPLFASAALSAQCGTTIISSVSNATWTLAGSPYCVNATIAIGRLTIQPGVEVRIAPGVSLQVVSWVRALGTRTQPIVFRAQNLAAGRWGGIEFVGPVPPNNLSQLEHCILTEANNSAVRILDNHQVSLRGCLVRNNTSPLDGGGLRVVLSSGTVSCVDCEIEGNGAVRDGGGVHSTTTGTAGLSMTDCRIKGNVANQASALGSFRGGGIWAFGNMELIGCHVLDNRAQAFCDCFSTYHGFGGAIYASSGTLRAVNTLIMGNVSALGTRGCGYFGSANGGGIFATAAVTSLELENCLLCCNASTAGGTATQQGSGLHTAASSTVLRNCTFASNSNEGVRVASGNAGLVNCIVFANQGASVVGAATVDYSCIQGGFAGGTGNIAFNPQFVGTGCLPEHYALSDFSPCVDAGDPTTTYNDACRPPGLGTARNDIGALGGSSNCGFAGPSVVICGAQAYGVGRNLPNAMSLDWSFTSSQAPYPGILTATNGFAASPSVLLVGLQATETPLSGVTLLVDPASSASPLAVTLDAAGGWAIALDLQVPFLVGVPLFLQTVALSANGTLRASNGLRISACQ